MERAARPESGQPSPPRPGVAPRLTAEDFAARFAESFRLLWLIAAGVTRDRALAEDIVQDAAVIALRKLDEFEPGTSFNAWMGQTVRFVAFNASRREAHRRARPLEPAELDQSATGRSGATLPELRVGARGELSPDQAHFDDQMMQALDSVSEMARACLLLRTLGDLEYAEISRVLGIPEGTAMSHVHRTRKALRDRLAPHFAGWGDSPGGQA